MLHTILTGLVLTLGSAVEASPSLALHGSRVLSSTNTMAQETAPDTIVTLWRLTNEGSEARYRVREQLAGFDFPNDAMGTTHEISGTLALGPDGSIVPDQSEFRIQLASLTSDNERRDGYVGRRTLEVEEYPEAILTPRRFLDLPNPLPQSGTFTFQLQADLTLHGETHGTVWEMTAEFTPDAITGFATTAFPFDTFGISVPSVARVLSVADDIRLELDFRMVTEGDQGRTPPLF